MKNRKTPRQRAVGNYYRFSLFNVFSFNFLAGNIIVLYAMRMGAGSALVGLIAASYQITFIFSILGRNLVGRVGAVRLLGRFWILRYVAMAPVLITALPFMRQHDGLSLAIIGLCAFSFNVAKGIGITAVRPIVGELSSNRERGSFLSNQQLIYQTGAAITGLTMAWMLGPQSSLGRYALLLTVGVFTGLIAATFALRLPEPVDAARAFNSRFSDGLRQALGDRKFTRFLLAGMAVTFVGTMVEAFLLVYFRTAYGYADQMVVLFTVAGSLGAGVMAVISRSLIDRTGAKPLLFTYAVVVVLILVPVAVVPSLPGVWVVIFPALVYFFFSMGRVGTFNAADNYFYAIIKPEDRLDVGIVFGLGNGVAGTLGSILGGFYLSGLEIAMPSSVTLPFSVYFASAALIMTLTIFWIVRLDAVDSLPIPDALGILVTPRDLRAIRLLNRLRRSKTEPEEQAAVRALADSTSRLPLDELALRIKSPSLQIRMEAINALRDTPLSREVEDLLIADVQERPFTTANLSVELLGLAGVKRAIPVLRGAVGSADYQASSRAIVALARLDDRESIGRIEELLRNPPNARVGIFAVKALEIFRNRQSLPLVLQALARIEEPFQRDEYILSCARLMGFFDWFYGLYLEFLEDQREGLRSVVDAATGLPPSIQAFVENFAEKFRANDDEIAGVVSSWLNEPHPESVITVLAAALHTPPLLSFLRFRFLLIASVIALSRPADG